MRPSLLAAAALAAALVALRPSPAPAAGWNDETMGVAVDLGDGWDVTTAPKEIPGEKLGRAAARFRRDRATAWLFVYANAPADPAKEAKGAARLAAHLLSSRYEPTEEDLVPGISRPSDLGGAYGLMLEFEVGKDDGVTRLGRAVLSVHGGRLHFLVAERPAEGATPENLAELERLVLSLRMGEKKEGPQEDLKAVESVPPPVAGDKLASAAFRSAAEMRQVASLKSGLKIFRQLYLFEGGRLPSYLLHLMGKDFVKDGTPGRTPDLMLLMLNNKEGKEAVTLRVELGLKGYSEPVSRTATVDAGKVTALSLSPVFKESLYELTEQRPGAINLKISDADGRVVYEETERMVILGRNDFFWKDEKGRSWAPALGAFVTPHDSARQVDALLGKAKKECDLEAMVGYQPVKGASNESVVKAQVKAVYEALAKTGYSYVNAPFSVDARAQRIKFPTESLEDKGGNCVETVLVFASALEAMGMQPVILVYEDHAQVAVRAWKDNAALIVLETTLCGRAPYEEAERQGRDRLQKAQAAKKPPELVDLQEWRKIGITPVPR